MNSDTQTVTIQAEPERVFAFLAAPENLPKWAINFCQGIRQEGDRWLVRTEEPGMAYNEVEVKFLTNSEQGVIDFLMVPTPGVEALAASRVVPNGEGATYIFTQFQPPDMPDEVFAGLKQGLTNELRELKHFLER